MNFKVVIYKVLFCSLVLVSLGTQAATPDAGQVVQQTVGGVLDRLAEERAQIDAHPERIYDLIQELVLPHFDFVSMSKWVLGRSNWSDASEGQRDTFVDQFRTLLVRTYAKALLEYSQEKVKIIDVMDNPKSNLVTVKTEVKQPGGESGIPINYRMHISGGEWKVVDVAVDGISLVRSYRGSFASEINANGLDSLLAKLVEKNNKLASAISSD